MAFNQKTVNQHYEDIKNNSIGVYGSNINFSDPSIINIISKAIATTVGRSEAEVSNTFYEEMIYLFQTGMGIDVLGSREASGEVEVTFLVDGTLPTGSVFTNNASVNVVTLEEAVGTAGGMVTVPCRTVEKGSAYNIPEYSIDTENNQGSFQNQELIKNAVNKSAFVGGRDIESENELNSRVKNQFESAGLKTSQQGMINQLLLIDEIDIANVQILAGVITIVVSDSAGNLTSSMVASILNTNNFVLPAGLIITEDNIEAPDVEKVDYTLDVITSTSDLDGKKQEIIDVIDSVINASLINTTIYLSTLTRDIRSIKDIVDVKIVFPTNDLPASINKIYRINSFSNKIINITQA